METWVVTFAILCLALFTGYLLYSYSDPSNAWTYTGAVYVSWLLGFCGVILLPLDIAYAKRVDVENNPLLGYWIFVFWSTFFLAWIIDPLLQSYHDNGSYHAKARIIGAIKENICYYAGVVALVVAVFLLILFLNPDNPPDIDTFVEVLVDLGTVYGMLFIVVLLGYGLVAAPRSLWQRSDSNKCLRRLHFTCQEIENEYQDSKFELEAIIKAVKMAEEKAHERDDIELKAFIADVIAKCPLHVLDGMDNHRARTNEHKLQIVDMKTFAALHAKLLRALRLYKSTNDNWQQTLQYADELEALVAGQVPAYATVGSSTGRMYWWWRLNCSKVTYKSTAVLCSIFSLAIIWGEITILFVDNENGWVLSVYGMIVHVTSGGVGTLLATFLPLFYMANCMFYTMFGVKFLKYYKLTARATDASGLLFNAYYLCRLQFSLGYHFLLVLDYAAVEGNKKAGAENHGKMHTALQKVVGNMSSIGWFNRYSPIVLITLSLATAFNWHAKVLGWIGVDVFKDPQDGNAEHNERIEEGVRMLKREREKRNRRSSRYAQGSPFVQAGLAMSPRKSTPINGIRGKSPYNKV